MYLVVSHCVQLMCLVRNILLDCQTTVETVALFIKIVRPPNPSQKLSATLNDATFYNEIEP